MSRDLKTAWDKDGRCTIDWAAVQGDNPSAVLDQLRTWRQQHPKDRIIGTSFTQDEKSFALTEDRIIDTPFTAFITYCH